MNRHQRRTQIVKAFVEGKSIEEIVKQFETTEYYVKEIYQLERKKIESHLIPKGTKEKVKESKIQKIEKPRENYLISKETKLKIAELVKNGMSTSEAALKFKISYMSARSACLENGVKIKGLKTEEEKLEIANYVGQGHSVSEAAKKYKISDGAVKNYCNKFEIEIPEKAKQTIEIIAALFDKKKSTSKIAKEFSRSRRTIDRIYNQCIEAGIPLPKRTRGTRWNFPKESNDEQSLPNETNRS